MTAVDSLGGGSDSSDPGSNRLRRQHRALRPPVRVEDAQRFIVHTPGRPDVQGLRMPGGHVYVNLPSGPLVRSCLDATGLVRDQLTGARRGWVTWEGRPSIACCFSGMHGPIDRDREWPYAAALGPRHHMPARFPARFLVIPRHCSDHIGVRFADGRVLVDTCDGPPIESGCATYALGAFGDPDGTGLVWERDRPPSPCCADPGHSRPGAWTWKTVAWPVPYEPDTFERVIQPGREQQ